MKDEELSDHPEGGRFKEIYRSAAEVVQDQRKRSALTHIYFSLNKNEVSRFHKVASDEVWNLYEGSINLYLWDEVGMIMDQVELSSKKREYCCVIRAGVWQAALPLQDKALVGCSVAPGFDFQDFELIDPDGYTAKNILQHFPDLSNLVYP
jgi:uncharacterized protein